MRHTNIDNWLLAIGIMLSLMPFSGNGMDAFERDFEAHSHALIKWAIDHNKPDLLKEVLTDPKMHKYINHPMRTFHCVSDETGKAFDFEATSFNNPLVYAIKMGNVSSASILLQHKATVTEQYASPFNCAIHFNQHEICKRFLDSLDEDDIIHITRPYTRVYRGSKGSYNRQETLFGHVAREGSEEIFKLFAQRYVERWRMKNKSDTKVFFKSLYKVTALMERVSFEDERTTSRDDFDSYISVLNSNLSKTKTLRSMCDPRELQEALVTLVECGFFDRARQFIINGIF